MLLKFIFLRLYKNAISIIDIIDLWEITTNPKNIELKKQALLNASVPFRLLKNGDIEDFFHPI